MPNNKFKITWYKKFIYLIDRLKKEKLIYRSVNLVIKNSMISYSKKTILIEIIPFLLSSFSILFLAYYNFFLSISSNSILFIIYIAIFFFIYLILSTISYFTNIYQYNRYTSFIQEFWRTAFFSFWFSEIFFLFIFLNLFSFISPELPNDIFNNNNKLGYEYIYCFWDIKGDIDCKVFPVIGMVINCIIEEDEEMTEVELIFLEFVCFLSFTINMLEELQEFFSVFSNFTGVYWEFCLENSKKSKSNNWVLRNNKAKIIFISYQLVTSLISFLHSFIVLFISYIVYSDDEDKVSEDNEDQREALSVSISLSILFSASIPYVWIMYNLIELFYFTNYIYSITLIDLIMSIYNISYIFIRESYLILSNINFIIW